MGAKTARSLSTPRQGGTGARPNTASIEVLIVGIQPTVILWGLVLLCFTKDLDYKTRFSRNFGTVGSTTSDDEDGQCEHPDPNNRSTEASSFTSRIQRLPTWINMAYM